MIEYITRLPWWRRFRKMLGLQYDRPMPIEDAGQTWYTVKEAAKLLGMTKQGIHDYLERYDHLERRRAGRVVFVSYATIAWIKHNKR